MNDEWWMINDEWWMMNDEWWMMNDKYYYHYYYHLTNDQFTRLTLDKTLSEITANKNTTILAYLVPSTHTLPLSSLDSTPAEGKYTRVRRFGTRECPQIQRKHIAQSTWKCQTQSTFTYFPYSFYTSKNSPDFCTSVLHSWFHSGLSGRPCVYKLEW